jgi:hypothetical protein
MFLKRDIREDIPVDKREDFRVIEDFVQNRRGQLRGTRSSSVLVEVRHCLCHQLAKAFGIRAL